MQNDNPQPQQPHCPRSGKGRLYVVPLAAEEPKPNKTVAKLAGQAADRKIASLYELLPQIREIREIAAILAEAGDLMTAGAVRAVLREVAAEAGYRAGTGPRRR